MVQKPRPPPCLILFLFLSFMAVPFSSGTQHCLHNCGVLSSSSILPANATASPTPSPSSSNRRVIRAIIATAVITLAVVAILLFLIYKYARHKQKHETNTSFQREAKEAGEEFRKGGRKVKQFNADALCIRNCWKPRTSFAQVIMNPSYEEEEEDKRVGVIVERHRSCEPPEVFSHESYYAKRPKKVTEPVHPNQQPPAIFPRTRTPALAPLSALAANEVVAPTPLPSSSPSTSPTPPPPPPPPPRPMTPKAAVKRSSTRPARSSASSLKPPPAPRGQTNTKSMILDETEESMKEAITGRTKLKPLHWDKVIANADHSMVWDQIKDGSLRFEDDLIETLFGYTTANTKPRKGKGITLSVRNYPATAAQVFILEPRRSQNMAIVLKSLAISRKEILDAILEGLGITTDILEKLLRISPTQEEAAKILQFNDDPIKLADAESFLYHILKTVPSAFNRIHAMLFRSNYDMEILHLKECLQTLELASKELRTRGLFFKLLEAILKAGNRMNAGTSRGNAQGFNLTALRKLSDIKSTDGKTTLLSFVVEQVVRSEGRRRMLNRNRSLDRSNNQRVANTYSDADSMTPEERNVEYLQQGLPSLGGLSAEFSNVKRAATIDYDGFISTCSSLAARAADIRLLITQHGDDEGGGFAREMKGFLEECGEELKLVEEEQTRILDLVRRTTEYYQAGACKDKGTSPLHLFVIVKDFLDMVDLVGVNITQKLQKQNVGTVARPSLTPSTPAKPPLKFADMRLHLVSNRVRTISSSESDDDF